MAKWFNDLDLGSFKCSVVGQEALRADVVSNEDAFQGICKAVQRGDGIAGAKAIRDYVAAS